MLRFLRRRDGGSGALYALFFSIVGIGAALGLLALRDAMPSRMNVPGDQIADEVGW